MLSFNQRVKRAREHAKLGQAELARRIGVKQQNIDYLEKKAKGSRKTLDIARETGIDADWLATGKGEMLHIEAKTSEPNSPNYGARLSPEAVEMAKVWMKLPLHRRRVFRDQLFFEAAVVTLYPWLSAVHPSSESYAEFERRVETDIERKMASQKRKSAKAVA